MTEQLYKKFKNRYIPIGYSDGFTGFPSDGIWLVQQKDGHKSSECIIKYEDLETAKPAINLILGYKEKILNFIMEKYGKGSLRLFNETPNDFVLNMLKEITK